MDFVLSSLYLLNNELSKRKEVSCDDKKHYIKNKLSKCKEISFEEGAGYRDALNISYARSKEIIPLRESDIKGLDRVLMKYDSDAELN